MSPSLPAKGIDPAQMPILARVGAVGCCAGRFRCALVVGALASAAVACQAHGRASGQLDTGATVEATGRAEASADADANARGSIKLVRGDRGAQLDYCIGRPPEECEIKFEYTKANLRTDDAATVRTLNDLKQFLREHQQVEIEIQGHTDSRGTDEYNLDLSNRRAAALRKWLIDQRVDEKRMTSVGKGELEAKPRELAECRDLQPPYPKDPQNKCQVTWQKSRRVVFSVTAGAESVEPPPTEVGEKTAPGTSAPAREPEAPRYVVGLATGVMLPFGDAEQGFPLKDAVHFVVPIEISFGLWLGRSFALGLQAHYGVPSTADGACASLPTPCTISGNHLRVGVWGELHLRRAPGPMPWLGAGLAWERLQTTASSSGTTVTNTRSAVPEGNARLGVDWMFASWLRAGPFFGASASQYAAAANAQAALHEWVWIGIRGAHDF